MARGRGGEAGGDKLLVRREEVTHHVAHYHDHRLGVEDRAGKCVKQNDEGDKGDDGVGRDAEGKGVDLAVKQVGYEGLSVLAPAVPLGAGRRLDDAQCGLARGRSVFWNGIQGLYQLLLLGDGARVATFAPEMEVESILRVTGSFLFAACFIFLV